MRNARVLLLGLCALAASCGGGGGGGDGTGDLFYVGVDPQEPGAGDWRTWVVDVDALLPPPPPAYFSEETADDLAVLHARAAARGVAEEANVDFWNEGACRRWNEYQRARVAARNVNPPKAARGYALVSIAMYDAMVVAWRAKFEYLRARPSAHPTDPPAVYGPEQDSPSYVSERAAVSAAARAVLNVLFPSDVATTDQMLEDALDADLDACVHFPGDVLAGQAVGDAVAQQVLALAATDGSDDATQDPLTAAYTESGIAGRWARTPPGNVFPPLLPGWGVVDTWLIPSGDFLRPDPPPAYGSAEWTFQMYEVYDVVNGLDATRQAIATFWADGPGTQTPPGHWNEIAADVAVSHALETNEPRMARMLAALGAAQHDAFVSCWECKYFYDVERPITAIHRDVPDPAWTSFIVTPPFPAYPSGHSSTSGVASQVLGYLFPSDALDLATMANEAKDSRLYGGIHWRFDNDTGMSLGRTIGSFAIDRLATDGAD